MSDILSAVALTQSQFQRDMAIALARNSLDQQSQVLDIVEQASGATPLQSGDQPLNAEGLGQVVNILA